MNTLIVQFPALLLTVLTVPLVPQAVFAGRPEMTWQSREYSVPSLPNVTVTARAHCSLTQPVVEHSAQVSGAEAVHAAAEGSAQPAGYA